MKIRNGFVSNSSSSSFALIGKCYNQSDFEEILFEALTDDQKEEYEDDKYEFVEGEFAKMFPDLEVVTDWECDCIYIGESPGVSEAAKKRVAKMIRKFDKEATKDDVEYICEEVSC